MQSAIFFFRDSSRKHFDNLFHRYFWIISGELLISWQYNLNRLNYQFWSRLDKTNSHVFTSEDIFPVSNEGTASKMPDTISYLSWMPNEKNSLTRLSKIGFLKNSGKSTNVWIIFSVWSGEKESILNYDWAIFVSKYKHKYISYRLRPGTWNEWTSLSSIG